ncbi:hypothetical protein SJA_C2-00630 [Sphingobium indicum UT26S]|uniref:Uncharacterized protein n=1 Tax=Sphingobium indicum (strain DSM 16413 / CCM 7287 / MTCC 6362 / UT26 / NBRC 101211 / UT26S) TaxID=452662 RepID=D4Z7F7_SPHIU|nr:hypothetical protein SJA_C2-00630 [Sphingobium indicum UT26S]
MTLSNIKTCPASRREAGVLPDQAQQGMGRPPGRATPFSGFPPSSGRKTRMFINLLFRRMTFIQIPYHVGPAIRGLWLNGGHSDSGLEPVELIQIRGAPAKNPPSPAIFRKNTMTFDI